MNNEESAFWPIAREAKNNVTNSGAGLANIYEEQGKRRTRGRIDRL